ncbi:hypothetical protein DCC39_01580 [Pueribacillus theae]|uniref:DUF4227 domain-containing protein n=1 Tax=Pueribacillus theae TaxID=2171751 RepID=A0A2U1K7P2_9BACI|nr:YqzK family protein [Pueribacillus theae]PWA13169.1 hypothetical protein DCC39_01580 [Pueribacillus theae]
MSIFRTFLHILKVLFIFVVCTLFFYFGLVWINQEYENYNRYNQPEGNAIKVSSTEKNANQQVNIVERIKLFYHQAE